MAAPNEKIDSSFFRVSREGKIVRIYLCGSWRLNHLEEIRSQLTTLKLQPSDHVALDGREVVEVDTAGAMLIYRAILGQGIDPDTVQTIHFKKEHLNIGLLVKERLEAFDVFTRSRELGIIEKVGKTALDGLQNIKAILTFLGEATYEAILAATKPTLIRVKELFIHLERAFIDAIPVITMVTFLIGVVVSYLFALQIEKYGANIFVVDAVALAMCRELSPIIVAIIVAGRSGSAFTAHIGTMKLNEEIDAMETLGLSPMQVLVLPRLLALIVAMPLLVFLGDIAGIIGGMLIADQRLGITGLTFVERLHTVLPTKSFIVGMIKAPVFAIFIAVIGCRMGLAVENNARSIGTNTTSTVVQSIVSVIILNAIFAVVFAELGI